MARKTKHIIVLLRHKLRLTQREFAEKAGLSYRTIQDVERGLKTLSPKSAAAISRAFGVDEDALLANDLSRVIMDPDQAAMAKASVAPQLLQDYLTFRSYFAGIALRDPEALLRWRETQEKAWAQFLKDRPGQSNRPTLNVSELQSIKDDVDLVIRYLTVLTEETAKTRSREK